jgi:hypothetical protein
MTITLTPLPELNRKAFDILVRELGAPDALRFFGQIGLGSGNYTEERRGMFDDLTMEEYRKRVEALRKKEDRI